MSIPRAPAWALRRSSGVIAVAVALTVTTAILAPLLSERHLLAVALLYLLIALIAAAAWGYVVGGIAALAADLIVNFFYIEPVHTLTVQKPVHAVALMLYLAVALVGASMLALLRRQVELATARRAEAEMLLKLTSELAHATSRVALERLCAAVAQTLHARGAAILSQDGAWHILATTGDSREVLSRDDQALATEVAASGGIVRTGAAARRVRLPGPGDTRTFVPISNRAGAPAVLRIRGEIAAPRLVDIDGLLTAFGNEAALALERVRLAADARQAEELRRADEFKNVILSSVSHDLRSPLTAIKAAVGSLRSPGTAWNDSDRAAVLATIETEVDRLTATVTGLLEMSRLEGGTVRARIEPLRVRERLDDARSAAQAVGAGRVVTTDIEGDPWVQGDETFLLRVLGNLVENAARYSTPGGSIRLCARASGPRVLISVADEGPGVAPADLPHVFEKFYRGRDASGTARGSGLGLAIARAMVELCGGSIRVENTGTGAEFTVELRAAVPAVAR